MGIVTSSGEITSIVPAKKLFTALTFDSDTLIPKLMPQAIKSIDIIEGDGGTGSIKKMTFADGKYIKHKIDALDKDNMTYSYTMTEGDPPMGNIEAISYEIKFESTGDGGCKSIHVSKYHPKPGSEINEEEIEEGKEKSMAVFKAVEAYLIANPEA